MSATFFLLGSNIEKYPEAVTKLAKDGHLLGDHSTVRWAAESNVSEESMWKDCPDQQSDL